LAAKSPDPRDAIRDRFERGEITKEEADVAAIAAGFSSMETRPDFSGVDCCDLPSWKMPQFMSWVIYRSSEKVLALSEEHRMQTRIWQSEPLPDKDGDATDRVWRLRAPDRLTVYDIVAEAVSEEQQEGRPPGALRFRAELGAQFIRGVLTAYGKRRGVDEHAAVLRTAWPTIDLFDRPCNQFDPKDIGRENEDKCTCRHHVGTSRTFSGTVANLSLCLCSGKGRTVPRQKRSAPPSITNTPLGGPLRRLSLAERPEPKICALVGQNIYFTY
jgi:hypothetical protein